MGSGGSSVIMGHFRLFEGFVSIALCLLMLAPHRAVAKWPFTIYSTNEGLAQSVVYCLFQDSRGYLWMGTQAGVCRFDGRNFTNFSIEDGLTHNVIRWIAEGPDRRIYLATERGISVSTGTRFEALRSRNGFTPLEVRTIAFDGEGTLWGGSYVQGLFRYQDGNYHFLETGGFEKAQVRSMLFDSKGRLWVGFYGTGIGCLENGQWRSLADQANSFSNTPRCFMELADGRILFGANGGLFQCQEDRIEEFLPDGNPLRTTITSLGRDGQGNLWIGTTRKGAYRVSQAGREMFSIEEGLPTDGVQSILVDHEGSTWFGTYGGGVCRLGTAQFRNFTPQQGFPYANVHAIYQDRAGVIWLGTNGGGLTRLEKDYFTLFSEADGLVDDKILCLKEDGDQRLWIGTLRGISLFKNGAFQNLREKEGLPHNTVYSIEQTEDGLVYAGTLDGMGIWNGQSFATRNQAHGLPHQRVECLRKIPGSAELLIGTARGLVLWRDDLVQKVFGPADGLPDDYISDIYVQTADRFWVATPQGLILVEGGVGRKFGVRDGLSAPLCYAVVEGQAGTIWVGTNNGLNRLSQAGFTSFSFRDGLLSNECNPRAAMRDAAGNLWFGTPAGVTIFRDLEKTSLLTPPFINLERVRVLGKTRAPTEVQRLENNENFLEFHFSGVSFVQSSSIQYAYKLKGLDRNWTETQVPHASYAALPPGSYEFLVRARNGDGVWSLQDARCAFTIVPPYYQTPWFVLIVLLILGGLIVFRYRTLTRRAAQLEAAVEERTQELARSNAELERLALRDQLTQVNNRHYLALIMDNEVANLKRGFFDSKEAGGAAQPGLGIILIDLDYFKMINDAYGHVAGDRVLQGMVHLIRTMIRESDVIVRWGGEEFLILLRGVLPDKIGELAERLRLKVEGHPFEVGLDKPIRLSISLGFCRFPSEWNPNEYEWADIIHLADLALYQAKRTGRNRTVGFQPMAEILDSLQEYKMYGTSLRGLDRCFTPVTEGQTTPPTVRPEGPR